MKPLNLKTLLAETFKKYWLLLTMAAMVVLLVIALVWSWQNLYAEPVYGDTPEYWAEATTLKIDSWRTIGYPVVLKIIRHVSIHYAHPFLYIFQALVAYGAFHYFFYTLNTGSSKKITAVLAAVSLSIPLVLHFAFSVLTDSLGASLFIIFCTALARIVLLSDRSYLTVSMAVAGAVSAGFIRLDLLTAAIIISFVVLIYSLIKKDKILLVICVLLLMVCAGTQKVNNLTQTANLGRPHISLAFSIFDRTARKRLPQLMPYMPAIIKERITPQEARDWQQSSNDWVGVATPLADNQGQKAMLKGSLVAIQKAPLGVIKDIGSDFVGYMITPAIYYYQTAAGQPHDSVHYTYWTNSRMAAAHRRLTKIFLINSFITLALVAALLLTSVKNISASTRSGTFMYWGFVIVVIGGVHALQSSIGFHIRYALPIFIIEIGLVLWKFSDMFLTRTTSKAYVAGKRRPA